MFGEVGSSRGGKWGYAHIIEDNDQLGCYSDLAPTVVGGLDSYSTTVGARSNEAAGYINRASQNIFTYLKRWLRTGLITPKVSSMIERMMREIARRLKRIAFGWSPEGAARMARIIIKRFTSAAQWEKYWKNKLKIEGKIVMVLQNIKTISPQPLGR